MSDRAPDLNEEILAELKAMNHHLAHIRAAAEHYIRKNLGDKALQDMLASLPRPR